MFQGIHDKADFWKAIEAPSGETAIFNELKEH